MKIKKIVEKILIVFLWLFLWSITSIVLKSKIIPSPQETFNILINLLTKLETYKIVGSSLVRVLISLIIGVSLGVVIGMLAGVNELVKKIFEPLIILIKSTPVVCFIIILWLYVDKALIPSICGILLCFPIIYSNVLEGYSMVDSQLVNMSTVYKVPFMRKLKKLYLPSTLPYLFAGILTSIGICWKATIAAEVISILNGSIGMQIYNGKVLLEFDYVFAWTIIIVICSVFIEIVTRILITKINFYERFKVI